MTTVEVFAPTWCPAAYVPHEDEPEACHFAADVDWLAAHGVTVVRATLSEQPGRFVEHDAVRFLMNVLGPAVLPLVMVDGFLRWHGSFPTRDQLAAWTGVESELAAERVEVAMAAGSSTPGTDGRPAPSAQAPGVLEAAARDAVAALDRFVGRGAPQPVATALLHAS